jgi:hypothetical protein
MPALLAYAAPDAVEEDESQATAAWRDGVREYALARPQHVPTWPRDWRRWAWLWVLALHVLLLLALRVMPAAVPPRSSEADVVTVELIEAPLAEPALLQPESPPFHNEPSPRLASPIPRVRQPKSPSADAPVVSEPTLQFHAYNPDGSVDIPGDLAAQLDAAQPRPNFIPLKVVPSPILNPRRALKVRPNHFAQYWSGTDGMPLHESVWRYVTATKEFVAPWGGHYGCTWILILVACADIPDKPWNPPQVWKPATELDEQ